MGDTTVEIASRGAMLGKMALIDGRPRSAAVVTFSRYVMGAMAQRMRRMNDDLRAAQAGLTRGTRSAARRSAISSV